MHIPAVKTVVEMPCSMIYKVSQYLLISFFDLARYISSEYRYFI